MVGTAQAADFAIFIRKIGYSVGLEDLVSRAADFGRAYGSLDSFRYADWMRLVREKWGLTSKSDHISDVFGVLGIVRVIHRDPIPGPIGEALGILSKRLDDKAYSEAVRFLVLLAVITHDGDVFLNALAASFQRSNLLESLLQVIRSKREILYTVFRSYQEQEAVFHAVRIDRQRTNRGSSGGKTLDSLSKGVPLGVRVGGLGLPQKIDIHHLDVPSEDYLDKVLVTRRGWAEALGLYGNGALTDAAVQLLSTLRANDFGAGAGSFLVWPAEFEVSKARFDKGAFASIPIKSTLDTMRIVCQAISIRGPTGDGGTPTGEPFVSYVAGVYGDYKALSQNRSMIRNELPLEVLGATWYAQAHSAGSTAILSRSRLEVPGLDAQGIITRASQTIELAVSVRRREGIPTH